MYKNSFFSIAYLKYDNISAALFRRNYVDRFEGEVGPSPVNILKKRQFIFLGEVIFFRSFNTPKLLLQLGCRMR